MPKKKEMTTPKIRARTITGLKKDELLKKVLADYDLAREYKKQNLYDEWKENLRLYNSEKKNPNDKDEIFVPEVRTQVDTYLANIGGADPRMKMKSVSPIRTYKEATEVVDCLLMNWWEKDCRSEKVENEILDSAIYGTGISFHNYNYYENRAQSENVSPWDFYIAPTARNKESADYMGHEYYTSKKQLNKIAFWDAEDKEWKKKYAHLDKLKVNFWCREDEDEHPDSKKVSDEFKGSTVSNLAGNKDIDQVHVIRHETCEWIVEIANRQEIILLMRNNNRMNFGLDPSKMRKGKTRVRRDQDPAKLLQDINNNKSTDSEAYEDKYVDLPTIMPFFSYSFTFHKKRHETFWGDSLVKGIADHQRQINGYATLESKNIRTKSQPPVRVEPSQSHLKKRIRFKSNFVIVAPRNSIEFLDMNVPIGVSQKQVDVMKEEMRRATGISDGVQGLVTRRGRFSATQIAQESQRADTRFAAQVRGIQYNTLKCTFETWFSLARINITEELPVYVETRNREGWDMFRADRYIGEYTPIVELKSVADERSAIEAQEFAQVIAMTRDDPYWKQDELRKEAVFKLNPNLEKELTRFVRTDEEVRAMQLQQQRDQLALQAQAQAQAQNQSNVLGQAAQQPQQASQTLPSFGNGLQLAAA